MTTFAATLQSFFTERLAKQRQASPHTIAAYRDTLKLLLEFMKQRTGKQPSRLDWHDLNVEAISDFLDHLQAERGNSARTRNARLTAIRSLFIYAALRHPEHAAVIAQVLAIPPQRFDKTTVSFLDDGEVAAILAAIDRNRWEARRDYTIVVLAVQTGLRLSELLGLNCGDIVLGTGAHLRCQGKGRKQRAIPIASPAEAILRSWLDERHGRPDEPAFCTRTGRRLSPDAIQRRVSSYAAKAAAECPSLKNKKLSPHTFRHTNAMALLHAGVDTAVIALWLGHADLRSTNAYLHADLTIKERALDRLAPAGTTPGRYRAPDQLLTFLETL